MAPSLTEPAALRRLAHVYRRILALAVPAALAGCQDSGDVLAPESANPAGEVSAPVAEAAASEDAGSLTALGRIAFSAFVAAEEGADIWTMSSTGGGTTRVTSFEGAERTPAWSPDHKQIAFQRARNGKLDIYVMNADGSNKHWALPTAPAYPLSTPSWSPDGKSLLVQVWLTSSTSKPFVGKIDLVSKTWTLLAPAFYYGGLVGSYPRYDKDGKWIYFVDASTYVVRRFQPNGGNYYVDGFGGSVGDLTLSPDGTKFAVSMYRNLDDVHGNREIIVVDMVAHKSTRLTDNSATDVNPTWSPDGTLIAFASDRSGKFQIYTMNSSTGGNLHKITNKTYGAANPSWYR
jgi:Tol biopolymer transport system component